MQYWHNFAIQQLPDTTHETIRVIEEAMLWASHSFFLFHLFQVVVVLSVFIGSEWEDRDSKTGDWMARVAERAQESAIIRWRKQDTGTFLVSYLSNVPIGKYFLMSCEASPTCQEV